MLWGEIFAFFRCRQVLVCLLPSQLKQAQARSQHESKTGQINFLSSLGGGLSFHTKTCKSAGLPIFLVEPQADLQDGPPADPLILTLGGSGWTLLFFFLLTRRSAVKPLYLKKDLTKILGDARGFNSHYVPCCKADKYSF